jgi:L-iditol 2-dehydrogenase
MELRDFEVPAVAPDAMLLKVDQVGLCGTDKHMYHGHFKVHFPIIPGHEFTGTLVQVGREAHEHITVIGGTVQEGDQVAVAPSSGPCGKCFACRNFPHRTTLCTNRTAHGFLNCEQPPYLLGGFSEYVYIRPNSWLFKLPEDMHYPRAVLTEPAAVALRAVERALAPGVPIVGEGLSIGKTALVLGCGPVGLLIIAVLKHCGVTKIIALDRVASRVAAAQQMGADVVCNTRDMAAEERSEFVLSQTDGGGAHVVFESVGVPPAFQEALDYVCRGGILIESGHFTDTGSVEIRPFQICNKDVDIRGMWAYPLLEFRDAIRFLHHTTTPVDNLLTHTLPLAETEAGIHQMSAPEGVLKIVVQPGM